jgi:hypothetical protein
VTRCALGRPRWTQITEMPDGASSSARFFVSAARPRCKSRPIVDYAAGRSPSPSTRARRSEKPRASAGRSPSRTRTSSSRRCARRLLSPCAPTDVFLRRKRIEGGPGRQRRRVYQSIDHAGVVLFGLGSVHLGRLRLHDASSCSSSTSDPALAFRPFMNLAERARGRLGGGRDSL